MKTKTILAALLGALTVSPVFADGLPEGYTQLPFLKASGNCQVKTGLTPASNDTAVLTFELSTVSGNQNLWCSRNDTTASFTAFMIADKVRLDRNTTQVTSSAGLAVGTKYTLTANYGTGEGEVRTVAPDASVTTLTGLGTDEYTPATELCLFASHTTDVDTGLNNYGSWTFYSFTLIDADGNPRCNLVPAWRASDGVLGLYDTVREVFLTNGLTGTLTLGDGYTIDENGVVHITITANAQGTGTVQAGDGEAAATATVSIAYNAAQSATFTATPGEGRNFYWTLGEGVTLTSGTIYDATISVTASKPSSVTARFFSNSSLFAKLVDGTFHYYFDIACSDEVPGQLAPESIAGCVVLFASDAEYQALVPYTNELATAFSVVLQDNVSLTADADWRAFDFDMNSKTVSLQGWDLIVHKPQGSGRFTSGNLINPAGFTCNSYASFSNPWYTFKGKESNNKYPETKRVYQSFTVPKARNVYLRFKTRSWQKSGYSQYVSAGIDAPKNLISRFQSGTGSTANTHIQTTGIYTKTGLAAGSRHELQFTNYNGWTYAGYICLCPASYLTFDIPEGEEYVNTGITLGGTSDDDFTGIGLQVYKTGKGQLTMSKVNNKFGGSGVISMVVEEGRVKKEAGATCGAQYSRIVVEDGGQFDLNGRTYHDYDYTLAGSGPDGTGALTSSVAMDEAAACAQNTGTSFLRHVALGGDATIYATNNMGMIFYNYSASTMTMNGHTVTYDGVEAGDGEGNGTGVGAFKTFLGNMSYSGSGKIVVAKNGWIQPHISSPTATDTDVEVYGRFWMNSGRLTPVKSLVFKEGSLFKELNANPGVIVVNGTYGPNVLTESADDRLKHPKVQLGDATHLNVTLDLSQWTTTFDDRAEGTLSFYTNMQMTVALDIGERTAGLLGYAYYWKTKPPETVQFVRSENMARRGVKFTARDIGLHFESGVVIHIR